MSGSEQIGVSSNAKQILVARKKLLGKSFSKLIDEYVGVPEFKKVGRKGNFADVAEYIKISISIGLLLLIVFTVMGGFNSEIQSSTEVVVTNTTKELSQSGFDSLSVFDYILPVLLLAFIGFSVMSARLIPSSYVFVIISVFALILLPFIGIVIENMWEAFTDNFSYVSSLPITNFLLSHSVIVLIIYSVLVAIALISKDERVGFNG